MQTYDQEDWERLTEYVAGGGSEVDRAEIRARIAAGKKEARIVKEILAIWGATEQLDDRPDVDAAWNRLQARTRMVGAGFSSAETDTPPGGKTPPSPERESRNSAGKDKSRVAHPPGRDLTFRRRAGVLRFAGIAGTLVACLFVAILVLNRQKPDEGLPDTIGSAEDVFITQRGQRALVRLNDGTEVRLNVESRLTVPRRFAPTMREVILEGEAYFNVVEDSGRPFVVRAGSARVEVLGTQFNLSAYPERSEVEVFVTEGEVALGRPIAAVEDTVVLHARHLGIVKDSGVQVMRRDVDSDQVLAWMHGRLILTNARFPEVADALERWYNLNVEYAGVWQEVEPIDVVFERETVGDVLKVIAATLNLRYEWERDTVTFYPASSESLK